MVKHHNLRSTAYSGYAENYVTWKRILNDFAETCTGTFFAIGGEKIVFSAFEDALLFKLTHGGELVEMTVEAS